MSHDTYCRRSRALETSRVDARPELRFTARYACSSLPRAAKEQERQFEQIDLNVSKYVRNDDHPGCHRSADLSVRRFQNLVLKEILERRSSAVHLRRWSVSGIRESCRAARCRIPARRRVSSRLTEHLGFGSRGQAAHHGETPA